MAHRTWQVGQYVVTPFGDHRIVLERWNWDPTMYWVGQGDWEHAELYPGDELCTSDEWAAENEVSP